MLSFISFISSVQFSCSVVSDSLRPRPPCPSPTPGVHSNSHPLSRWCHPAISSSVVPFSSCPRSFPVSESFPMSQLFAWGGQSPGVSALASFLPKNTQGWSPLEWTGWISLQSKGLSGVFSNTTVQKHQFFGTQLSYYVLKILTEWGSIKGGEQDQKMTATLRGSNETVWGWCWNFEERRAESALGASKAPNPSLGSKKCGWKQYHIVEEYHIGYRGNQPLRAQLHFCW